MVSSAHSISSLINIFTVFEPLNLSAAVIKQRSFGAALVYQIEYRPLSVVSKRVVSIGVALHEEPSPAAVNCRGNVVRPARRNAR